MMFVRFHILCSLMIVVCFCKPYNPKNRAKTLKYENESANPGEYKYSFYTSNKIFQYKEATTEKEGNNNGSSPVVQGFYTYQGPDGRNYTVVYTADENGYHPRVIQGNIPTEVVDEEEFILGTKISSGVLQSRTGK